MLEKFKKYISEHNDAWQLMKFTIVSLIGGVLELALFAIFSASLKNVNSEFDWFIYHYKTAQGGLGTFFAFLISVVGSQIFAFIVNRKKTFASDVNLAYAVPMYFAMIIIFVIGLNIYLANILMEAMSSLDKVLAGYIVKVLTMLFAFVEIFTLSKYVIMRKKKPEVKTEKPAE